jgi:hypothetical protein
MKIGGAHEVKYKLFREGISIGVLDNWFSLMLMDRWLSLKSIDVMGEFEEVSKVVPL